MNNSYAAIFPGQGSQSVGMLQDFARHYPVIIKETIAEASSQLDFDLGVVIQDGPVEVLNQTAYTQPALLTASVAAWRIWQTESVFLPVVMAGHSLGEYTALVCADAISLADAAALVHMRGQLMQSAVCEGQGAMAAIIGLADELVEKLCQEVSAATDIVAPANYNADGQVVVAGNTVAVEALVQLAKDHGAKMAKLLAVSVPSHCRLMRPAAEKLHEKLMQINLQAPTILIVHNVNTHIASEPDAIRQALIEQLYHPVLWTASLRKFAEMRINTLIEFGPGKVLTGLAKRTSPSLPCLPVYDQASLLVAKEAFYSQG